MSANKTSVVNTVNQESYITPICLSVPRVTIVSFPEIWISAPTLAKGHFYVSSSYWIFPRRFPNFLSKSCQRRECDGKTNATKSANHLTRRNHSSSITPWVVKRVAKLWRCTHFVHLPVKTRAFHVKNWFFLFLTNVLNPM